MTIYHTINISEYMCCYSMLNARAYDMVGCACMYCFVP